jgi:hypothetical protein
VYLVRGSGSAREGRARFAVRANLRSAMLLLSEAGWPRIAPRGAGWPATRARCKPACESASPRCEGEVNVVAPAPGFYFRRSSLPLRRTMFL